MIQIYELRQKPTKNYKSKEKFKIKSSKLGEKKSRQEEKTQIPNEITIFSFPEKRTIEKCSEGDETDFKRNWSYFHVISSFMLSANNVGWA